MPQKPKFTKEEIIDSALDLVIEGGIESLTARALGNKLNCSARPLFTVFNSMEEISIAVISKAKELYDQRIAKVVSGPFGFKETGKAYIQFAIDYPHLFKLLFSYNYNLGENIQEVLRKLDNNYEKIINTITNQNGLASDSSSRMYAHLWIYTHGIAMLCADNVCRFNIDEVNQMLTEVYKGLEHELKEKK